MEKGIKTPKPPNSPKSEHLAQGVKPIIACVGSRSDFGLPEEAFIKERFSEQLGGNHNVSYVDLPDNIARKKFLGGGRTWTISTIDNLNKFSERFFDCTGLIIAGKDEITGEDISFLTHQDPYEFLKDRNSIRLFTEHLQKRLAEISTRCKKGTIDAVIVGGKYPETEKSMFPRQARIFRQDYLDSIKLLSLEVQQTLGFEPIVINGPKIESSGYDSVYYDNRNRRIYFIRPETNPNMRNFTYSSIEEEKKKWEKKQ